MTVEFRVGDLVVTSGSPTQGEIQISEIVDINGSSGSVGQFLGKSASGLLWEALQAASTSVAGIVQLTDSTSSVSTTTALTANQGYNLQQQINSLIASSNLTLAGTIDASTALIVTVTTEGASVGFTVGDPLPVAASGNDNYFVIVTIPGTMTPPGGSAYSANQGDWFLSNGTGWEFLDVGFNASYATTTAPGIVRLATDLDVQTGTDTLDAVTSAGLQSKVSDSTSTASSTTIASSTAVKAAYDAAAQAQTDATAAASAASLAQADATQALSDSSAAQSDATQALSDSAAAQSDATQALSDASSAQNDASQALLDAAAAQSDANQALLDAAAASAAAATAGTDVGNLSTLTTTDKSSAVAAINEVNSATNAAQADASQALLDAAAAQSDADQALLDAAAAQADASQALLDASSAQSDASAAQADASQALLDSASAQGDANQALLDAAAAQSSANAAQADATQALSDASAAQATADAALPKAGGTMTGVITFDATQTFPGTVGDLDFQAKGDLVTGYGANAFGIQSIGTDGQVLTADSTCASGMKWAAGGGGGGGSPATPTVAGLLPGCADSLNCVAAVGDNALLSLAGGTRNTALGINAGCSITTGSCNVAIGSFALCSVTTTASGTAVGHCALLLTTGDSNTAVGERAGRCITTGVLNTAVGRTSLEFTCGGNYNSGVGVSALRNACGSCNVALGYQAGFRSDCDNNVFLGVNAGFNSLTGANNIFLGHNTGSSLVAGNRNVIIGAGVDPGVDSSCCLMIGSGLFNWLLGDSTGAVKPAAGIIDCAGSCGTAGQVLMSNGVNAVCWGTAGGGGSAATPTALGTVYGCSDAAAPHNTALGNGALEYAFVGCCNTAIGVCSQRTGDGCGDTSIGAYSLWCSLQGPNIAIGCGAGCDISSGCYNVVIGTNVQTSSPSSQCELAIGYTTGQLWLSGDCSKAIKPGAGVIDCAGSCGTAGQVLQSTGSNAIQWASPAPGYNGYQGYTATTSGTKFNVTGYLGELGINFIGQLNIFTTYESGYNIPGSNALIFINGYNGTGSSTVQAMNTSTGTFAVESVLYPAYTDITVTFTPSITTSRMNFYIRFLDAIGNGGPYNGNFFTPFLTLF